MIEIVSAKDFKEELLYNHEALIVQDGNELNLKSGFTSIATWNTKEKRFIDLNDEFLSFPFTNIEYLNKFSEQVGDIKRTKSEWLAMTVELIEM